MCRKATPVLEACTAQPVQTQLGTVDIMASLGTPNAHFDERQCLNFTLHRLSDTVLRQSAPPGSIYPRTLFYVDFSYVATVMDRLSSMCIEFVALSHVADCLHIPGVQILHPPILWSACCSQRCRSHFWSRLAGLQFKTIAGRECGQAGRPF